MHTKIVFAFVVITWLCLSSSVTCKKHHSHDSSLKPWVQGPPRPGNARPPPPRRPQGSRSSNSRSSGSSSSSESESDSSEGNDDNGDDGFQPPNRPPSLHTHDHRFRPRISLRITARNFAQDCTTVYAVLVNNSIPGPELRFKEGEKVWIRVYNDIPNENFTMHWHGLTQRMSPFSDGTPAASQWPIPPLHYFDYEFQLRKGDAGTYYYHSHVSFGASTAFGAFIIEEGPGSRRPFDYDDERVIMFNDVYHTNGTYITQGLQQAPFRWSGEIDNVALNGKSRDPQATTSQNSPSCELAVVSLEPDKTYRLRFIGATSISEVFAAFEGHSNLTLIEVDGQYVTALNVDHVEIHTGQRYSLLLRSKSQAELSRDALQKKRQYWIQMETRGRTPETTHYGILTYNHRSFSANPYVLPLREPLVLPNETFAEGWLDDRVFSPLRARQFETVPKASEVTRRVIVQLEQAFSGGYITYQQQGAPWFEHFPSTPYLVSLYKNEKKFFPNYVRALANDGFDPVTRTFPAKIGEVLEIVWQLKGSDLDGSTDTHPMHAHGDHYFDIGTGVGQYDPQAVEKKLRARDYRALKRDTSTVYRERLPQKLKPDDNISWRAWRIRVKNAGVWMMHCHKLQHMVMGMQTVWVFGEAKDLKRLTPDQAEGYLDYRGKAYGNATYSPKVVHFWHS